MKFPGRFYLFSSLTLFIAHSKKAQSLGVAKNTQTLHGIGKQEGNPNTVNSTSALSRHSPLSAFLLGPNSSLLVQTEKIDLMSVVYLVWSKSRFHLHDSTSHVGTSSQMLDKLDPWKSTAPSGRCRWFFSAPGFPVSQQQLWQGCGHTELHKCYICLLPCLRRWALKATGFCLWCSSKSHSCPHFSKAVVSRVNTSRMCPLGQPIKTQHCYKPPAESKMPHLTHKSLGQLLGCASVLCYKLFVWTWQCARSHGAELVAQRGQQLPRQHGHKNQKHFWWEHKSSQSHNPGSNPAPTVKEAELKFSGWLL